MENIISLLVTGLMIGGVYGLVALGMVVVYKSTGILNLMHGMAMVLMGYLAYALMVTMGVPLVVSLLVIIVFSGLLYYGIQWVTIRPLIGQPILATVMMTFALNFLFLAIITYQWSELQLKLPSFIPTGRWLVGGVSLLKERTVSFVATLLLFGGVGLFFRYTKLGLGMRAVADNSVITESTGVNVRQIFAYSWVVCGVIGAITAILLSSIYDVLPGWGVFALSKGLPIMLLGGLESLPGALIGGMIVGVAEVFGTTYIDPLVGGGFRDIIPFILMLLILLFKPWGLFGWERIERV